MHVFNIIKDLQNALSPLRSTHKIALVPTMGNLHEGHISLVRLAQSQSDCVIVTIFVNPSQFSADEDFDDYPRTLTDDLRKLEGCGTTMVLVGNTQELYPLGAQHHIQLRMPGLDDILCGIYRPHHFPGVAVIVNKLFQAIQPNIAVFGEKDYQQLLVVKTLIEDFLLPIELVAGPIYREPSGLAMSSRNRYLTEEQQTIAHQLQSCLLETQAFMTAKTRSVTEVEQHCNEQKNYLSHQGFGPQYYEVRFKNTLAPYEMTQGCDPSSNGHNHALIILAAAYLGKTRLIDNLSF